MPSIETKRLFIALELPTIAIDELSRIQIRLEATGADVKWVTPSSQIHSTLKFLGATRVERIPQVIETLERVGLGHAVLSTALESIDAFPSLQAPQVLWAGLTDPGDRMKYLARVLDDALTTLGIDRETRPFKAHATLGRVRSSIKRAALIAALEKEKIDPIPLVLDKITLFQSELTPAGPVHTPLCRIPLTP
jgi:2'-5' RNA ligase